MTIAVGTSGFSNVRFVLNRRSKVRYQKLDGIEHAIVPTTMMVEGVHAGNHGPLYYSANQLSKTLSGWDHKPSVVYHPKGENGGYISACTPEVIDSSKIGILLNTRFTAKKQQQTDVWIDIGKSERVDPRVMEAVRNESPMNVSTGMHFRVVGPAGVWNGEDYVAEVGDFTPDHLAILPDIPGACSIQDGAGLLVNEDLPRLVASANIKEGVSKHLLAIRQLIINEMSNDQVYSALIRVVRAKIEQFGKSWDGWIQDVYAKYFVYSSNGLYFKQAYKTNSNGIELVGESELVERVYSYEKIEGHPLVNSITMETLMMTPEQKKNLVDSLVANGGWNESRRIFLNSLKDEELADIVANNKANVQQQKPPTTNTQQPAQNNQMFLNVPEQQKQTEQPVVTNSNGMDSLVESELSKLSPAMREVFSNLLQQQQEQKMVLVNQIVNTPGNRFNPEFLKTKNTQELQGIVSLIEANKNASRSAAQQNYVGNSFGNIPILLPIAGTQQNGVVNNNQQQNGTIESLSLPE